MPGASDLFAQLEALGLDAGAIQPSPDLTRVGLVYLMASAEKRGLPVEFVSRLGRASVLSVPAEFGGFHIKATTRCLRIRHVGAWDLSNDWNLRIVPASVAVDFDTAQSADSVFSSVDPGGLVHTSEITSGRWTADPVTDEEWMFVDASALATTPVLTDVDIFPGFVMEMAANLANTLIFPSWFFEEWGP